MIKDRMIIITVLIFGFLLISIPNSSIQPINEQKLAMSVSIVEKTQFTLSEPLEIFNDTAFELYGFSGTGTPTEPYMIYDLNITADNTNLIHIENTTKHFLIKYCLLNGLESTFEGISLVNVTNGVIDENNIINCGGFGINLEDSSQLVVNKNYIRDCLQGIIQENINNSIFQSNTVFNSPDNLGIYLGWGNNNTYYDNRIYNCEWGIYLEYGGNCYNNSIIDNKIYNCTAEGIYLREASSNTVYLNEIYDCTFSGIILDSDCRKNFVIQNTVYRCETGINLLDAHNNTVADNIVFDIEGTTTGINVWGSNFNFVLNNTLSNCTISNSFVLGYSHNNTIMYNTIESGKTGLSMQDSCNNTVSYNLIVNNSIGGLSIFHNPPFTVSANNTVTWNTFIDNSPFISSQVKFVENNTLLYNYYDDYLGIDADNDGFGDTPYHTDYTGEVNDTSPRMYIGIPTLIVSSPVIGTFDTMNIILEYETYYSVVTDVTIYVNEIANSTNILSGASLTGIVEGTNNVTIFLVDQVGNEVIKTVIFTVEIPDSTTTTPITTTSIEATSETTTTTSKTGSLPGMFTILLAISVLGVCFRRFKKT